MATRPCSRCQPRPSGQDTYQQFSWRTKTGVLVLTTGACAFLFLIFCAVNISGISKLGRHDKFLTKFEDEISKILNDTTGHTSTTTSTTTGTTTTTTVVPIPPQSCSTVKKVDKFDCHPEVNATEARCRQRGCCWQAGTETLPSYADPAPVNVPQCFFPDSFRGYRVDASKQRGDGLDIVLRRVVPSGLPSDIKTLKVRVTHYNYHTARITIEDASETRWVPPLPPVADQSTEQIVDYKVVLTGDKLSVYRRNDEDLKKPLFSTPLNTLIFSDQFLQISTSLPSDKFYGLGEMKGPLLHRANWTRRILFNKDQPPRYNRALYGAHALMVNLDDDNVASGVYIKNSNAMDVVLQPQPAATYRTLGGIFDFFIFTGPTPAQVFAQYQRLVGLPAMIPYWSLGFHLCRYGYWSLNETKKVYERNVKSRVPLEVQWNDIDYMDRFNMFTYDKKNFAGLDQFVKQLHDDGRKYVMIFDPAVSGSEKPHTYRPYDLGIEMDIFVRNVSNQIVPYKVWNEQTSIFPDFSNPATETYWKQLFKEFHNEIEFDGAWIDMNEPSNQKNGTQLTNTCPRTQLDFPPVVIGGEDLFTYTACMSDKMNLSSHYNLHNLYPHFEARATYKALVGVNPKKRPFIISRSSSPGQGLWSNHWTGDIDSTWADMRQSIPDIINFAMYGMPMVGADICGFQYNTTDELCARWQALGAFYPFTRNHNDKFMNDQDPAILGGDVLAVTIWSLQQKYIFAPYLYTLMYRAHVYGETVFRAMMFNYPSDPKTHGIDDQFMWGEGLLIAPALHEGQKKVKPYFPGGIWYHYNEEGRKLDIKNDGETKQFDAPLTEINLFLRGGNILPGQDISGDTLSGNRKNGFFLFVALDGNQSARGELFWDDGDSLDAIENEQYTFIEFSASFNTIVTHALKTGYKSEPLQLKTIKVFGVSKKPTQLILNGGQIERSEDHIQYHAESQLLEIVQIDLNMLDASNSIVFN